MVSGRGLIAVGYYYSNVVEVFDTSGNEVWSQEVSGHIMVLRRSPDGEKIAVQSGDDVYVLSREGEVLWHADDLGFNVMDVAWSPDSSMVAAACMERGVILRDGEIVLNVTKLRAIS